MRFLGRIVVLFSLMGLAACATIVKGSSEPIAVTTMPGSHASCTLTNGQGAVDVLAASTATVKKSRTDLDVVCADPASHLAGKIVVQSDVEPWDFGNILTAGLGLGVDWGTGAAYHYPTKVSVPLSTPVYPSNAMAPLVPVMVEPLAPIVPPISSTPMNEVAPSAGSSTH